MVGLVNRNRQIYSFFERLVHADSLFDFATNEGTSYLS